MGQLIAVLSGKGGTGKTSVCAALACALARSGERVLCIDCDVGLRNLDISLGLSETESLSFLDVSEGGYPLSKATRHPAFENLSFLTAPVGRDAEQVDMDALRAMLQSARAEFDYVFLDAPAGVDAGFRLSARFAERILLVTLADPAAIRDASRAGELLELMGKQDVRLIVNRVDEKLVEAMGLTVDDIMDRAGLPLIGVVPEDARVTLCAAEGKALLCASKRGAAAACTRIARRMQGRYVRIKL